MSPVGLGGDVGAGRDVEATCCSLRCTCHLKKMIVKFIPTRMPAKNTRSKLYVAGPETPVMLQWHGGHTGANRSGPQRLSCSRTMLSSPGSTTASGQWQWHRWNGKR